MTTTVYATGYTGKTPGALLKLATELDAVVYDIRFSPVSRNPIWNKNALAKLLGDRYVHCRNLGNAAYKEGNHAIRLVDQDAGLAQVIAEQRAVILLCVCADAATCHRTFVAGQLAAAGVSVTEIAIPEEQVTEANAEQLTLL